MRKTIERPQADKKKIHCKNEFELCYLRHQYFRKVNYNPTVKDMEPYQRIASQLASKTFFTYRPLLVMVGLEKEDIINIANVHLVSFLGLFSLEKMPKKYEEFIAIFEKYQDYKPKKTDILDKNKANFTLFLKQRMEDLVRVCRQKAKNIKGLTAEGFFYCYGPNTPPKRLSDLIKNYDALGFKKLESAVYKSIRKKSGVFDNSVFMVGKNYYVAVPIEKKSLTIEDFNGADMNPRDTLHSMNPEEVYFTLEDKELWEKRQEVFDTKPSNIKTNIIKNFISKNRKNKKFREEVQIARKLLKEME